MLIGGHVSPAGGLPNAHARGVERGCDAIQVFHQNPRAWRPTNHKQQDVAGFRELMADGPIRSFVIHAVYLINCASRDPEISRKSAISLAHALRLGDAAGADGVVLHPGSQAGEPLEECLPRIADCIRAALAESERCPLLLENTAGMQGTIGRSFAELADLIDRAGGAERVGVCLDCCHLLASGFDVRDASGLSRVVDDCERELGLERVRCLHVNDSRVGLGANRDLHANLPEGELGRGGLSAFLSEPRFEGLPALLEVPGPEGRGPDARQIEIARELRAEGMAAR
ncbi:MAG: deoxyribonuclease IV [Thermoleophilaceae bacterium]|jgi:deoxyribonuclease-4|nr:deoxyribonuclease IV [Thermoleophilaceae bacterium]